jgi:UDP-N-acetylglucosamine 2-epimerase (non-hydrolysing)
MKKILFILGTRPEAIKLNPIIACASKYFDTKICLTNQHPNINYFLQDNSGIVELPNIPHKIDLPKTTGLILQNLSDNQDINSWHPDLIIVHGDTSSALSGALYAFHKQIKLCHIESGLRTHQKLSPFPEEANRYIIDYLAEYRFVPTVYAESNLKREGIIDNVFMVGNSIVDVINKNNELINKPFIVGKYGLVTLHRRENWNNVIEDALKEIGRFAKTFQYPIIFALNNNPVLQNKIQNISKINKYIYPISFVDNIVFHNALKYCQFVITDSGGVQEEAVCFGKPLLIMREYTERQEIIANNCGFLVSPSSVYNHLIEIITHNIKFNYCPYMYGQNNVSQKIVEILYENILH